MLCRNPFLEDPESWNCGMHGSMHGCMFVRVHTCALVCRNVHRHSFLCACACACASASACVRVHACVCMRVHAGCLCMHACADACVCTACHDIMVEKCESKQCGHGTDCFAACYRFAFQLLCMHARTWARTHGLKRARVTAVSRP